MVPGLDIFVNGSMLEGNADTNNYGFREEDTI
jgi:hypothetical protein